MTIAQKKLTVNQSAINHLKANSPVGVRTLVEYKRVLRCAEDKRICTCSGRKEKAIGSVFYCKGSQSASTIHAGVILSWKAYYGAAWTQVELALILGCIEQRVIAFVGLRILAQ